MTSEQLMAAALGAIAEASREGTSEESIRKTMRLIRTIADETLGAVQVGEIVAETARNEPQDGTGLEIADVPRIASCGTLGG